MSFVAGTGGNTPRKDGVSGSTYTSVLSFFNTPNLPDVYKKQVSAFGNRSITGFIESVGAMIPTDSKRIEWREKGRLYQMAEEVYKVASTASVDNLFKFPANHSFRVNQTVLLKQGSNEYFGRVSKLAGTGNVDVSIDSYTATVGSGTGSDGGFASMTTGASNNSVTVIGAGSEFSEGTNGFTDSVHSRYVDRVNNVIIMKEHFQVSGSDATQIGHITVTNDMDGTSGNYWFVQDELDTRERFYGEMEKACLEGRVAAASSNALAAGAVGTKGLFSELGTYGNVFTGGIDNTTAAAARADFDLFVKQLDKQGNIEENMFYCGRDLALEIDNALALQNGGGIATGTKGTANANVEAGTSWGMFKNMKDMAINLGFSGVRRGNYDFYKTDWKYLNQVDARGSFDSIEGVSVPGGSSNVYNQMLSSTVKRPNLHVRYKKSTHDNRQVKHWVTGSLAGTPTDDLDASRLHYLTERCLITQAANNFILFKE